METLYETRRSILRLAGPVRATLAAMSGWAVLLLSRLAAWHERARQRQALLSLNDQQLKDIGLSRADVMRECTKSFWIE